MAFGDEVETQFEEDEAAGDEGEEVGEALAAAAQEPGAVAAAGERIGRGVAAGLADLLGLNGAGIEGGAEKWKLGDRRGVDPEAHLGKLERLVLNNLHKAFKDGDAAKVQELLGALNENPHMIKPVMHALNNRMAALGIKTGYETGSDNDGNSFLRVHVAGASGLGSFGNVTIGSDGRNSATVTGRRGDPQPADAAATFSSLFTLNNIRRQQEGQLPPRR